MRRDEREFPVDAQHYRHHPHKSQTVDQDAQQTGSDETLDGVDVAGGAADEVARPLLVVIGER